MLVGNAASFAADRTIGASVTSRYGNIHVVHTARVEPGSSVSLTPRSWEVEPLDVTDERLSHKEEDATGSVDQVGIPFTKTFGDMPTMSSIPGSDPTPLPLLRPVGCVA